MPRFKGFYVTERDGGLRYDYEVSWSGHGQKIVWEAKVRRGSQPKGHPKGQFLKKPIYVEKAVRAVVEHSIETLVDIEK